MSRSRFMLIILLIGSLPISLSNYYNFSCNAVVGNYTSNGTYKANLDTVLSFINNDTQIDYGYYNFSMGQEPDQVYVIALCTEDLTVAGCKSCINDAAYKLSQDCPVEMEAAKWEDHCLLHYANRSLWGLDAVFGGYHECDRGKASDVDQFNQKLGNLLRRLQKEASSGDSRHKYATGEANVTEFVTLYALMQCKPDLSELDCFNCLSISYNYIPSTCNGNLEARVNGYDCILRYDIIKFYGTPSTGAVSPSTGAVSPSTGAVTNAKGNNKRNTTKVISAIVVVVLLAVSFLLIILAYVYWRRRQRWMKHRRAGDDIRSETLQFDFRTVKAATGDFCEANHLGRGGFGSVYKGTLPNGQEVAVKRLASNSGQGETEFKNEVLLLAKLQHRNLVRLLGFCLEKEERLLVYEFVPNLSLDHFIFDKSMSLHLDWEKRCGIIGGIARGLLYLHEDSRLRIIHRDLKTSNILLDAVMLPKIADFGTARLFKVDQTHSATHRVVGTYGYMAPEYALHGLFSVKSDVYSFGIIVLEIITGQRNSGVGNQELREDLVAYVWRNWRSDTPLNVVDPRLVDFSASEIMRSIHIGLLCVQENEADRPSMSMVVIMLSSPSTILPVPTRPAYVMPLTADYTGDQSSKSKSSLEAITELNPR